MDRKIIIVSGGDEVYVCRIGELLNVCSEASYTLTPAEIRSHDTIRASLTRAIADVIGKIIFDIDADDSEPIEFTIELQ